MTGFGCSDWDVIDVSAPDHCEASTARPTRLGFRRLIRFLSPPSTSSSILLRLLSPSPDPAFNPGADPDPDPDATGRSSELAVPDPPPPFPFMPAPFPPAVFRRDEESEVT